MRFILITWCVAAGLTANAQRVQNARQIIAAVDSFNTQLPAEKLFLHFDKPYYAAGDTIWFKAYLFRAATYEYSPFSGLLYVDLINDSSKKVRRMSVPVNFGVSWGQLPLTGDDLREGSYTVCAYTRWMRNFGEECFFRRRFIIAPATEGRWSMNLARGSGSGQGRGSMSGQGRDSGSGQGRDSMSGQGRGSMTGQGRGSMTGQRREHVQRPDLQFMPEGGWLVAGISSRLGFKAVGEDGLGVDVQGTIVDSRDREVTTFRSIYRGMGECELTPAAGEHYAAVIQMPDGRTERYLLPAVKKTGIVLRVDNISQRDSLYISILPSPDVADGSVYHLVGLSRGVSCYGANFPLNKQKIDGIVSKDIFPSGIAHFTLFNEAGEPVNERIVFIDHRDQLKIEVVSDNDSYGIMDSIPLHIHVTDHEGRPVEGSFSLAVTDDAQVKADSLMADNILTHMLLTADLQGYVEMPGWYFRSGGSAALDALLLTQGWVGYKWPEILKRTNAPRYAAEDKFKVTGIVTNLLNRPVHEARVTLMSTGKMESVMDTATDKEGRFVFSSFPPFDSAAFVVQARHAKGGSGGLGVVIDEYEPPAVDRQLGHLPAPWYDADDSILLRYVMNNAIMLKEKGPYAGNIRVLQPVTVRAGRVIKGSHNLNGSGEADQVIDEAAITGAGKMNLKQLLQQTVKGFRVVYKKDGTEQYAIFQNPLRIVIDGVNLRRFGPERETLEYLTTEDVTGIEVMNNLRHTGNYRSAFLSPAQLANLNAEYSFIEVTTRSGNGLFMKKAPGVTTYKPLPVTWPMAFYRPRYIVKNGPTTDLRSTIHWQPSLVTGKDGRVEVSFYAASKVSTYTAIIQGSDMNGNIGVQIKKITISGGKNR